jgi:hypothetical protein
MIDAAGFQSAMLDTYWLICTKIIFLYDGKSSGGVTTSTLLGTRFGVVVQYSESVVELPGLSHMLEWKSNE